MKAKLELKRTIPVFIIFIIVVLTVAPVVLSAEIEPDSGQFMEGLPVSFEVTGLTANSYYDIFVDSVEKKSDLRSSSSGTLTFSYTFNSEGIHTVEVKENGTGTVVATAQIEIIDYTGMIIDYVVIIIIIGLIFGVAKSLEREVKV